MSYDIHEAFSLDSLQDSLLFWDDFEGDSLKDLWRTGGIDGNVAVVDAQDGGIIRLTTGATTNDTAYIDWADKRSLHVDKKVTVEWRVKLGQTADTQLRLFLRFDFNNTVYFQYDASASANWFVVSTNTGTTSADSGIAVDTDYHILRIECFPTDEVHYYIDGVECGNSPITVAANIPNDAGDYLQPYMFLRTQADAIKTTDIDYIWVRQDR